jgi:hypothetical protein
LWHKSPVQLTLLHLGFAVVGSLIAYLSTAKLNDWFAKRSWGVHAFVFLCMVTVGYFTLARIGVLETIDHAALSERPSNKTVNAGAPVEATKPETKLHSSPEDIFVNRYVAAPAGGDPTNTQWAVVLAEGRSSAPNALNGAAHEALAEKGYGVVPVFRPAILEDSGYRQLYAADSALMERLRNFCGGIIVGRIERTSSTDTDLQGLITVRLTLGARLFLTTPGMLKTEFQVSAKGGGFTQETAQAQANERLAHELKGRLLQELP